MPLTSRYASPLGEILLTADDGGLTTLRFCGSEDLARPAEAEGDAQNTAVFEMAKVWLDCYFTGQEPEIAVPLHLIGTAFQTEVWEMIRKIPYGQTTTYGELARRLAEEGGSGHLSPQAVGAAAARNPVLLIVPCHRVIRSDGTPGGYAGGTARKAALLRWEAMSAEQIPSDPSP